MAGLPKHRPDRVRLPIGEGPERRVRDLIPEPPPGGGYPWVLVAASDASDKAKAVADYVCDGTFDEEEINAALLLVSQRGGGIVQLSEGRFVCHRNVELLDDTTLRGLGERSVLASSVDDWWGGAVVESNGAKVRVENVKVDPSGGFNAAGVAVNNYWLGCDHAEIVDVTVEGGNNVAIYAYRPLYARIERCTVRNADSFGIDIYPRVGALLEVRDCQLQNVGPVWNSSIHVGGFAGGRGVVTGCTLRNCGRVYLASAGAVEGCTFVDSRRHAIQVDAIHGHDTRVANNRIWGAGTDQDATYAAIEVEGDRVHVANNTVRMSNHANQASYGLRISSTAENTYANGNDLLGSGRTGAMQDQGTGTVGTNRT